VKLWTLGRDREKQSVAPHFEDPEQQALLFAVIDAAHDLKEGLSAADGLIAVARRAFKEGNPGVVQQTSEWIAKLAGQFPSIEILWEELASHRNMKMRWDVACRLYWYLDENQSNRLFAILRHDKSKKVREMAVSRYEWRTNEERTFVKMFDAEDFDKRVRSGEVRLLRPVGED
jgi:hypothetical protein